MNQTNLSLHLSQMKIIKRIRNLWLLSAFEPDMKGGAYYPPIKVAKGLISTLEVPRKAQIISMKSAKDKFLEANPKE